MEERIIELEKKLAFQEYTIEELNRALLAQEKRLVQLEKQFRQFREQAASGAFIKKPEEETPPPHY